MEGRKNGEEERAVPSESNPDALRFNTILNSIFGPFPGTKEKGVHHNLREPCYSGTLEHQHFVGFNLVCQLRMIC